MDHVKLKARIDAEPANAAKTDEDVLAWCFEGVGVLGRVSTKRMWGWAIKDDIGGALSVKLSNADPEIRGLARGMLAVMNGQQDFDVGDASAQAFFSIAVAKGVITQTQRDALETLATTTAPRWSTWSDVGKPNVGDVVVARGLS